MDSMALRQAYEAGATIKAVCDEMAGRERNQLETKLDRILECLREKGKEIRRPDAIAAFRKLEECGCGKYVKGRHNWPSRFVWSVGNDGTAAAENDSLRPLVFYCGASSKAR